MLSSKALFSDDLRPSDCDWPAVVALPHELSFEQSPELLHEFVQDAYVRRGMTAQVSMHGPGNDGDHRTVHAPILLTASKGFSRACLADTRVMNVWWRRCALIFEASVIASLRPLHGWKETLPKPGSEMASKWLPPPLPHRRKFLKRSKTDHSPQRRQRPIRRKRNSGDWLRLSVGSGKAALTKTGAMIGSEAWDDRFRLLLVDDLMCVRVVEGGKFQRLAFCCVFSVVLPSLPA